MDKNSKKTVSFRREKELNFLLKKLNQKDNVLLMSKKRYGKTSLLKHLKDHLNNSSKNMIIIDMLHIDDLNKFINLLASGLLQELKSNQALYSKITDSISHFRPLIKNDNLDQVRVSFNVLDNVLLKEIFNHLFKIVDEYFSSYFIVFKNYDSILKFPEHEEYMIHWELSKINNSFIFSGNSEELESFFYNANRSIYNKTQTLRLKEISEKEYSSFILNLFSSANKVIDKEAIMEILKWTKNFTFYTEKLCQNLINRSETQISIKEVELEKNFIFNKYEAEFLMIIELLPKNQLKLLKAISIEKRVKQPTASNFLQKYNLGAGSSIKLALEVLVKKQFISKSPDYEVNNVFFANYLAKY